MGDWEDVYGSAGMSIDFAPHGGLPSGWGGVDAPSPRSEDSLTAEEWSKKGRGIKAGAKDVRSAYDKTRGLAPHFYRRDTYPINAHKQRFDTFSEAVKWAKEHPGESITRCPSGEGFIEGKPGSG